jgi:hypothetical protein
MVNAKVQNCPVCKKEVKYLASHMKTHKNLPESPDAKKCELCDKTYKSRGAHNRFCKKKVLKSGDLAVVPAGPAPLPPLDMRRELLLTAASIFALSCCVLARG